MTIVYRVKKRFTFSAAHRLPQVPKNHKCHYVHGHNYMVDVEIGTATLDDYNFVIDFIELDFFKEFLDKEFDHKLLVWEKDEDLVKVTFQNKDMFEAKVIPVPPTCEGLAELFALYIDSKLAKKLHGRDFKLIVTVWESSKSCGSFETEITWT